MLKFNKLFESLSLEGDTHISSYVKQNLEEASEIVFNEIISHFEAMLNEYGCEIVKVDMRRSAFDISGRILFHYDTRQYLLKVKNSGSIDLFECKGMTDQEILSNVDYDEASYYRKKGLDVTDLGMIWKFSDVQQLIKSSRKDQYQ